MKNIIEKIDCVLEGVNNKLISGTKAGAVYKLTWTKAKFKKSISLDVLVKDLKKVYLERIDLFKYNIDKKVTKSFKKGDIIYNWPGGVFISPKDDKLFYMVSSGKDVLELIDNSITVIEETK